jgi:hypothetical protein
LSGNAAIVGTAQMPDWDHYTIQIGFGTDPQDWLQLTYGATPVQDGELGRWDTTRYPDGPYTIRLAMYDHAGKSFGGRVHVNVGNTPTATPRPAPTHTPVVASPTYVPPPTATYAPLPPTVAPSPTSALPTSAPAATVAPAGPTATLRSLPPTPIPPVRKPTPTRNSR